MDNEKLNEQYARSRLATSPLSSLNLSSPLSSPLRPFSQLRYYSDKELKIMPLSVESYNHIKTNLTSTIEYILRTDINACLSGVCDFIEGEVSNIRALGFPLGALEEAPLEAPLETLETLKEK